MLSKRRLSNKRRFVCAISKINTEKICDFLFWGYIKKTILVLLLPKDLYELKSLITDAINLIITDMFQQVYNELDYRLDMSRTSKWSHIEHLTRFVTKT